MRISYKPIDQYRNSLITDNPTPVTGLTRRSPSSEIRMAWNGSNYAVVWEDEKSTSSGSQIYFARMDADGKLIGKVGRVTYAKSTKLAPDVAWTGREWAVVWSDNRAGNYEIYHTRMTTAGIRVIGGSKANNLKDQRITFDSYRDSSPRVLWTGSELAILWSGNGSFLARLSPNGTLRTIRTSKYPGARHFVHTGDRYGIVYTSVRADSSPRVHVGIVDDPKP